MRKILASLTAGIFLVILFLAINPRFAEKREALGEVGNTLIEAPYHQGVIVEGGARVLKAEHNLAVITRATKYMGAFGSNTLIFREIARIASEADHECERLEAVLDLAARSAQEGMRIIALAESACGLESAAADSMWQAAYDEMLERTTWDSVEAALAAQNTE